MNRKKVAVAAVGGVAALSLIGVGAGASFTDSASASQSISNGTIQLLLSTDGNTFGKQVSWGPEGPLTSAGYEQDKTLYFSNSGSIPIHVQGVTVQCEGDLVIKVSAYGQNFGCGQRIATSGQPVIQPGAPAQTAQVHFSVAPNQAQGATGKVTIVADATD